MAHNLDFRTISRRLLYKVAYRSAIVVWRTFGIETRGAMVAVWHDGAILVVKNSYREGLSLPGGLMSRQDNQDSRRTAAREMAEEVGITAPDEHLTFHSRDRRKIEGCNCRTDFYEMHLSERPTIQIDGQEIEDAYFLPLEETKKAPLLPMISDFIKTK